eukprot:3676917-Pyramimonas_sp.AAC.1
MRTGTMLGICATHVEHAKKHDADSHMYSRRTHAYEWLLRKSVVAEEEEVEEEEDQCKPKIHPR